MCRNGARRSWLTEYENASNSLFERCNSSLIAASSSARRSTMPSTEARRSLAASTSGIDHGSERPCTVSFQISKDLRGCRRSGPPAGSGTAGFTGLPPHLTVRTTSGLNQRM